jgi:hypothetical protein
MNSYERAAHVEAMFLANRAYEDLLADGAHPDDASEAAARTYDAEYRHELQDIYGEDFSREDEYDEPEDDE